MNRFVRPLVASAMLLAAATAQEQRDPLAFRDFDHVQRLRVVCEHQHFGRVVDLIADVPSGRITGAVLSMTTDDGNQVVTAPIGHLRYEPQSNLLHLGPCLDDAELHTPFDATQVRLERRQDGDGADVLTGNVLVSKLARGVVMLEGRTIGSIQGVTVELSTGHVGFCHVAAGRERAGDGHLHPAPWAALVFVADPAEAGADDAIVRLASTKEGLAKTPTLITTILQDALYRPRVYEAFAVAPPDYDR